MGAALISVVERSDHELSGGIDRGGDPAGLADRSDVLVAFSAPQALDANLHAAIGAGIPLVIGTTGLEARHHQAIDNAARAVPVLQTGNTSLGVTLLAHLVREAAERLGPDWDIEILEMHHRRKVDAPSGTALLLGEAAAEGREITLAENSERGRDGQTGARAEGAIGFASLRGGTVAGEHSVILAGEEERANRAMLAVINRPAARPAEGMVAIVGAGPGDADLRTLRALRLMQRADVVLYDRLVGDDIIELLRRDAERIYVGKLPNQHTMAQEDISQLMVDLARQGKRVLRLKGGDPFIFGRGGEEIETLAENGISFQVVPGITAASGCSAYAGIPLTHRDYAHACVFVTAHGKEGVLGLDWDVLLRPMQTVAVYMGLSSLKDLSEQFVARGADPNTPAAIIDNGTRPNQRVAVGTIATIDKIAKSASMQGPSMIIIGEVVRLRDRLRWFSEQDKASFAMGLGAKEAL